MMDLGDFTPEAEIGPTRTKTGAPILGRDTTTEEQRQEAIDWIVAGAAEHKSADGARATIHWSNGEPSILEVNTSVEHLNGRRVWLPDRVTEMLPSGAEIAYTEETRLRVLTEEVASLHERGMLS